MLTFVLAGFFAFALMVSLISLTDSAIKWRNAYRAVKTEMAFEGGNTAPTNRCAVVRLQSARLARPAPAKLIVRQTPLAAAA